MAFVNLPSLFYSPVIPLGFLRLLLPLPTATVTLLSAANSNFICLKWTFPAEEICSAFAIAFGLSWSGKATL